MELATSEVPLPDERLLIRELTHRISNEFTCAANMISLAAARATDGEVKATLGEVMKRLDDYARVHRALLMPGAENALDASAYLRQLCASITRSRLDRKNIALLYAEHPLLLDAQQCWLLGMMLYELINNAARHAFGETGGRIRVEIFHAGNHVECHVVDNGGKPFVHGEESGLKIVRELAASLGGVVERRSGRQRSASVVIFPAAG